MEQQENKNFIQEHIVGKRENFRKRGKHYLRVLCSGLVFGLAAAGSFSMAQPFCQSHFRKKERLEEAESTEAASVPEGQAESSEALDALEESQIQDVVQSELQNYSLSMESLQSLLKSMKQIPREAEQSIVTIRTGANSDFLGSAQNREDFPGLLTAEDESAIYILTSFQKLREAESLSVLLLGGNSYEAKLIAVDQLDNLAMITIDRNALMEKDKRELQMVKLGNSHMLQKGDILFALGAPAVEMYSECYGLLSSLHAAASGIDGGRAEIRMSISSDTAGGSFLFNANAAFVGILSESSGSDFRRILGISDLSSFLEQMRQGMPIHYLGCRTVEVTKEMQKQGIPDGVFIEGTVEGSPAYAAGILPGDIVTELNGNQLQGLGAYRMALDRTEVGTQVSLKLMRQRGSEYREHTLTVTVGER